MYILRFIIYSFVDRYLSCFYVLAVVNNVIMNIGVQVSVEFLFSVLWGVLGRGIAGSYDNSLIFLVTAILFSIAAASVYIPITSV